MLDAMEDKKITKFCLSSSRLSTEFLNVADLRPGKKIMHFPVFNMFLHVLTPLMRTFGVYYADFHAQNLYSWQSVHARNKTLRKSGLEQQQGNNSSAKGFLIFFQILVLSMLIRCFYHGPDVSRAMVMWPPIRVVTQWHLTEQTRTNMSARSATGVE